MATLMSLGFLLSFKSAPIATPITPRPVDSSLPGAPNNPSGLPVTTAGENPLILWYSSIIQAMVCASVPISGAGTSR